MESMSNISALANLFIGNKNIPLSAAAGNYQIGLMILSLVIALGATACIFVALFLRARPLSKHHFIIFAAAIPALPFFGAVVILVQQQNQSIACFIEWSNRRSKSN